MRFSWFQFMLLCVALALILAALVLSLVMTVELGALKPFSMGLKMPINGDLMRPQHNGEHDPLIVRIIHRIVGFEGKPILLNPLKIA